MAIVSCPDCGQKVNLPLQLRGIIYSCPKCNKRQLVVNGLVVKEAEKTEPEKTKTSKSLYLPTYIALAIIIIGIALSFYYLSRPADPRVAQLKLAKKALAILKSKQPSYFYEFKNHLTANSKTFIETFIENQYSYSDTAVQKNIDALINTIEPVNNSPEKFMYYTSTHDTGYIYAKYVPYEGSYLIDLDIDRLLNQ